MCTSANRDPHISGHIQVSFSFRLSTVKVHHELTRLLQIPLSSNDNSDTEFYLFYYSRPNRTPSESSPLLSDPLRIYRLCRRESRLSSA